MLVLSVGCVCVFVCACVYIHTYIHTHITHAHTQVISNMADQGLRTISIAYKHFNQSPANGIEACFMHTYIHNTQTNFIHTHTHTHR
jgi:hypothetical protein